MMELAGSANCMMMMYDPTAQPLEALQLVKLAYPTTAPEITRRANATSMRTTVLPLSLFYSNRLRRASLRQRRDR